MKRPETQTKASSTNSTSRTTAPETPAPLIVPLGNMTCSRAAMRELDAAEKKGNERKVAKRLVATGNGCRARFNLGEMGQCEGFAFWDRTDYRGKGTKMHLILDIPTDMHRKVTAALKAAKAAK